MGLGHYTGHGTQVAQVTGGCQAGDDDGGR